MKKSYFLFMLLFTSILIISCKEDEVIIEPTLIVSEDTLFFNEEEIKTLYLSTKPASESEYQIVSHPDWVKVSPLQGIIYDNIEEIKIVSQFESNLPGVYTGELKIMSTSGLETVALKGFVGEHTLYELADSVNFSVFSNQQSIILKNEGNVKISFNSSSVSNGYVFLTETSGEIPVGGQGNIEININRTAMQTGSYNSMIFMNINGRTDTISVKIDNIKEQKTIIESDITDAEFSRQKNELIYVSTNPLSLTIYNVANKSFDHIPLGFIPVCVSVSMDGNHAAVGHDGKVSYIDLVSKAVIKTLDVPCYIFDIALTTTGWAYAIPNDGTHIHVECINFADNTVTQSTGYTVYDRSKIKLHPSEKYIYLADNGVSPADLRKLDIQNGTADFLYDSPYHGDYASGYDLWFSEDGNRIFTKYKSVFKTSELKPLDMLYNGKITFESTSSYSYKSMVWLDHADAKNNLYVVATGEDYNDANSPFLYIFNATNLVFKSQIPLEKYVIPDNFGSGKFYESEPYFAFCNPTGNKVYVIAKATGAGLVYEWSIQEYNID